MQNFGIDHRSLTVNVPTLIYSKFADKSIDANCPQPVIWGQLAPNEMETIKTRTGKEEHEELKKVADKLGIPYVRVYTALARAFNHQGLPLIQNYIGESNGQS